MSNRSKLVEAALTYQNRGFFIVPVDNQKIPVIKGWQNRDEHFTQDHIQQLWANTSHNIGIVTGQKSNLLVLDVDVKKGAGGLGSLKSLEDEHGQINTYRVRTPSGGLHLYFKYPKDLMLGNRVAFQPGLDIRSDGGQVVAPPSRTKKGEYIVEDNAEIAEMPLWLIQQLQNPRSSKDSFKLPEVIKEGSRNDASFRHLCSLRAKGYDETKIRDEAFKLNAERVQPPLPDKEVEAIIKQVLSYAPGSEEIYLRSDVGNSERFADQWQGKIIYVAEHKSWYIWDGKRYKADNSNQILTYTKITAKKMEEEAREFEDESLQKTALSWARKSQSKERLKAMKDLAAPEMSVSTSALDSYDDQINLQNGILKLNDCKVVPHDASLLHTKIANVEYQPDAKCPRFLKFLDTTFSGDKDLISFIQRLMGYCLSGSTKEQCIFIFHGDGQNGKSVLMNVIDYILGEYSVTANANTFVKNNTNIRSDIARLNGARFVSASEVDHDHEWDEVLLKNITGGEKITARFLFKNEFEFRPNCKIIIATNNLPAVRGLEGGIWRRIHIIPFKNNLPNDQVDKHLFDKLIKEKSGILNFMIDGHKKYLEKGLAPPDIVTKKVKEYRKSSDIVQQFLDECCHRANTEVVGATDLYQSFVEWCASSANEVYTQKRFGTIMAQKGFESRRMHHEGSRKVCYLHLKLNDGISAYAADGLF